MRDVLNILCDAGVFVGSIILKIFKWFLSIVKSGGGRGGNAVVKNSDGSAYGGKGGRGGGKFGKGGNGGNAKVIGGRGNAVGGDGGDA